MNPIFITATGTSAGKTHFTCALARFLRARGLAPIALKPIETGVIDPLAPEDALALAKACARPIAECTHTSFYRAALPVSPHAVTRSGAPALAFTPIVEAVRAISRRHSPTLVEGAGGLFVPLDDTHVIADLAIALEARTILVAPDRLGVLSDVIAAELAAASKGLKLAAVILNRNDPEDRSQEQNLYILQERLVGTPVLRFTSTDSNKLLEVIAENLCLSPKGIRE